ncbi:non-heme ferritin [Propionivibrio dicarboxylicus]|uniref:Ferritin n=1 Tax=Propionivibrio dicarboxylicus TaxID=83767 RepID=A0A1G7ZC37_9RHOO|nr:non-heme ferritin [Propionivibrio dicarboxylicus]SDH06258.1 ferritin [Propionivibrio dicarboxylicus]
MLSSDMVERLNKQINLEQYSSNLYLQMSAWCDHQGYVGSAAFLKEHAAEELTHMHKLFDYVSETGALAVLGALKAPPAKYKSLGEVFKTTYEHELAITKAINGLVASALAEQDFASFQFLQWYVSEQHEEERLFKSILDKIEIIGVEGKGLYFVDKEIGKLAGKSGS